MLYLPFEDFLSANKGTFPAILLLPVVHEIPERMLSPGPSTQGYVARAVDYEDGQFIGIFNAAVGMDPFKKLAFESLASLRSQACVDPHRMGVICYSLGGFFEIYLVPNENGFKAGVIYYGMYDVPDLIKNLKVPILAFQGDADHMTEFIRNAAADETDRHGL